MRSAAIARDLASAGTEDVYWFQCDIMLNHVHAARDMACAHGLPLPVGEDEEIDWFNRAVAAHKAPADRPTRIPTPSPPRMRPKCGVDTPLPKSSVDKPLSTDWQRCLDFGP